MRFLSLVLVLLLPTMGFADPSVSGIVGTWSHGNSIIISGSGFGSKSPAAPLVWDNCEGNYIVKPNGLWDAAQPSALTGGDAVANMALRTSPFSRGGNSISAPHARSTKFIGGGLLDRCDEGPSESTGYAAIVRLNASSEDWYITYYARADPLWPGSGTDSPNHKCTFYSEDPINTNDDWLYEYYVAHDSSGMPYHNSGLKGGLLGQGGDWDQNPHPDNSNLHATGIVPKSNWWRHESIGYHGYQSDGWYQAYVNNHCIWTPKINGTSTDCDPMAWWRNGHAGLDINTVAIGTSFFRYQFCNGQSRGHDDAWFYMDDIYVDTTMSRVMLGNSATYANCTILEPQPPTAWADGSITVTGNLGAFTGSTAYLFVFDADNEVNATGYQITLGSSVPKLTGVKIVGGSMR